MAITTIHAIQATINKAVDYICKPAKTDESILISSFGYSLETVVFDRANLKSKAAVSGLHPKEEIRMLSSVLAGLQI